MALAWTPSARLKQAALERAQPLAASLELTYRCNWRCVFCYNPRHHDRRGLSGAEWLGVLDDLRELGTLYVALTGGEPLAHPEFLAVARGVRERAFALRILTNGALVTERARRRDRRAPAAGRRAEPPRRHGGDARPGDRDARLLRRDAARARPPPRPRGRRRPQDAAHAPERGGAGRACGASPTSAACPGGSTPCSRRATTATRRPSRTGPPRQAVERVFRELAAHGQLPHEERAEGGTNCGLGRTTIAVDPEGNVFPCLQWRRAPLGNVRETPLPDLWAGSAERLFAASVARAANDRLVEAGGALASLPVLPRARPPAHRRPAAAGREPPRAGRGRRAGPPRRRGEVPRGRRPLLGGARGRPSSPPSATRSGGSTPTGRDDAPGARAHRARRDARRGRARTRRSSRSGSPPCSAGRATGCCAATAASRPRSTPSPAGRVLFRREERAYPLEAVIRTAMMARLPLVGGLPLHAAGVVVRGPGVVFFGPSGAGKTTVASTSPYPGALRRARGRPPGEPFRPRAVGVLGRGTGERTRGPAPLALLVDLAKGPALRLTRLRPAEAAGRVLASAPGAPRAPALVARARGRGGARPRGAGLPDGVDARRAPVGAAGGRCCAQANGAYLTPQP